MSCRAGNTHGLTDRQRSRTPAWFARRFPLGLLGLSLMGCTGFYAPLEGLVEHDCVLVSAPAKVGAVVTGTVGVPVAIVALPFTLAAAEPGPGGPNLAPLAPVFASAQVGAVLLGGVPWLLALPFQAASPQDESRAPPRAP